MTTSTGQSVTPPGGNTNVVNVNNQPTAKAGWCHLNTPSQKIGVTVAVILFAVGVFSGAHYFQQLQPAFNKLVNFMNETRTFYGMVGGIAGGSIVAVMMIAHCYIGARRANPPLQPTGTTPTSTSTSTTPPASSSTTPTTTTTTTTTGAENA